MNADPSAKTITKQAEAIKRLSRIVDLLIDEDTIPENVISWVQEEIDDIDPDQFFPNKKETM